MVDAENDSEEGSPNLDERMSSLAAFEKLDKAIQLIEEALQQRPILKDLQVEPLLRSLAEGMRILSARDSDLDLRGLMLKHRWRVGQRFYVRAVIRSSPEQSFVVLSGQDVPEGIVIAGRGRHLSS